MVDALANANRIASSLGSLLLEGAESDICGLLVISRAFSRSAPVGTPDIALYLEENWALCRVGRCLDRSGFRAHGERLTPTYIAGGDAIQRIRVLGLSKPDSLTGASTDIREAARRSARFIGNLIIRDEKWTLESER